MTRSTDDRQACRLRVVKEKVDDDQEMAVYDQVGMPRLLAEVNARIHDLAAETLGGGALDCWEFRCECGAPTCKEFVSLPLVDYEALRRSDSPILAAGHGLLLLLGTVRERSAHLREEAKALRNQARQQSHRAQRNRDPQQARPHEKLDLNCATCGYGVAVDRPPDRCPMCGAWDWRPNRHA